MALLELLSAAAETRIVASWRSPRLQFRRDTIESHSSTEEDFGVFPLLLLVIRNERAQHFVGDLAQGRTLWFWNRHLFAAGLNHPPKRIVPREPCVRFVESRIDVGSPVLICRGEDEVFARKLRSAVIDEDDLGPPLRKRERSSIGSGIEHRNVHGITAPNSNHRKAIVSRNIPAIKRDGRANKPSGEKSQLPKKGV